MTEIMEAAAGHPRFNRYDPACDVVFLDAALARYSAAYRHVLDHELQHAINQDRSWSPVRDVWLDVQEDWWLATSTGRAADQLRDYREACGGRRVGFGGFVVQFLWQMVRPWTTILFRVAAVVLAVLGVIDLNQQREDYG